MNDLKIVIIEDEFFAANHLSEILEQDGFKTAGIYYSGESFYQKTDWNFDAALIDIMLAEKLTGLDVAKEMAKNKKPFIFITANHDPKTIKKVGALNPAAYISKPFKQIDVSVALELMSHNISSKIKLKGKYGIEEIDSKDILFIKTDGNYIEIETQNERKIQRMSLKEILDILPTCFKRVHRYYAVNCDLIEQKSGSQLIIKGNIIPISRSFKDNLS